MRLFHFSNDSAIATFVLRSVLVPSKRAPGMEWLNGPLVWAIEERVDFMYLFPRDCPRILTWATEQTNNADKAKWLGGYRGAAYIERERLADLRPPRYIATICPPTASRICTMQACGLAVCR